MPTTIVTGEYCKLYYKIGSTYTLINQRTSITGPNQTMAAVESTHMDSLAKERRPGIADTGTIDCEVELNPADAGHKAVEALLSAPVIGDWRVELSDKPAGVGAHGTYYDVTGFPTGFTRNGMTVESNVLGSFTIQCTGPLVRTDAAASGGA